MEWMLMPLKRYAEFSGRSRRKEFWMFVLFVNIVSFVLQMVENAIGLAGILSLIWALGTLVPNIAVAIRRMHDVGKSGWFILIPIYNIILAATPGVQGPNEYGPDPINPGVGETFA